MPGVPPQRGGGRRSELPLAADEVEADAIVWKSDLEPPLLDDIWLRSGDKGSL
jgi:hypothetical protein